MQNTIQKILVIRFRRVGDAILTAALCSSLKKTFPNAEVHYVLNDNIAPLFEGHPAVDKVISFGKKENSNVFRFAAAVWSLMRKNDYQVIIDVRSTVRTLLFALFSLSTPYRIGTRKSYSRWIHNFPVENRKDKSTDVISHLLMLLEPLSSERPIYYDTDFRLYITDEERGEYRQYMQTKGIDFSRPVMLAAVATRLPQKSWSKENLQQLFRWLVKQYPDLQIVFNYSGEQEKQFALQLHQELALDSHCFINIEANSLRELCALAANSQVFFGNEGGARHLVQAMQLPSFAIFPPGIPKAMWLPAQTNANQGISPDDLLSPAEQMTMSYSERFALITAESVIKKLKPMLDVYLFTPSDISVPYTK
jgi:heptosyltransferase-3